MKASCWFFSVMQRWPICFRAILSIAAALWALKHWKHHIIKQQFQAEWITNNLPKPNNTNEHWIYTSQPSDSNKYDTTSVCKFLGRKPTSVKITSSHQIRLRILQHVPLLGWGGVGVLFDEIMSLNAFSRVFHKCYPSWLYILEVTLIQIQPDRLWLVPGIMQCNHRQQLWPSSVWLLIEAQNVDTAVLGALLLTCINLIYPSD